MDDDYAAAVLDVVQGIPPGRAMPYGLIAEVVADRALRDGARPRGGPRQVGQVLARSGGDVPWWRVVDSSGRPPARLRTEALERLRAEGTPLTTSGEKVLLRTAVWWPPEG